MSGLFIPLTLRKDERVAVKAFYGCVGAWSSAPTIARRGTAGYATGIGETP
jgi:hypothetical protein